MKKFSFSLVAMLGLLATSCSSDEPMAPISGANNQIGFTVTADGGSRSTSSFLNGTDITTLTVSAWSVAPEDGIYALPGYGSPNTNNSSFFTNDVLTRVAGQGTFNYETDARYWPQHKEKLDFFAVVSNPAENPFSFTAQDGKPGLEGTFKQGGIDDMPDLLFATAFDQQWNEERVQQQNVSFHFDHAFAKVEVTAQVRNKNLRVYITDMSICGILDEASFTMPYKSGESENTVFNGAFWTPTLHDVTKPDGSVDKNQVIYTNVDNLLKDYNEENPAILDTRDAAKRILLGTSAPNDLLVLPYGYSGRNGSGKNQTYIKLMGYAYNISGDSFDEECDMLVYGTPSANGPIPAEMVIPIEFDWKMGTVNHYNIIFDCGNGGSVGEDPSKPAFVRIGYEVEVNPWTEGQNKPDYEYPGDLKNGK